MSDKPHYSPQTESVYRRPVTATRRMLVIYAHPDDEAFGNAGIILAARHAGIEVHYICATRRHHRPTLWWLWSPRPHCHSLCHTGSPYPGNLAGAECILFDIFDHTAPGDYFVDAGDWAQPAHLWA